MKIWICVSHDEYELPEVVADTPAELANLCNVTANTVKSCACKYDKGVLKWSRFRKVEIDD